MWTRTRPQRTPTAAPCSAVRAWWGSWPSARRSLAACGGDSGTSTATAGSSSSAAASTGAGGSGGGAGIAKADVPVGGGTIIAATKTVVTQPKAGEFKAFTSICTHMGCPVAQVSNGTIDCNCHGSQYDIATGAVTRGPATRPLAPKTVTVKGDQVIVS